MVWPPPPPPGLRKRRVSVENVRRDFITPRPCLDLPLLLCSTRAFVIYTSINEPVVPATANCAACPLFIYCVWLHMCIVIACWRIHTNGYHYQLCEILYFASCYTCHQLPVRHSLRYRCGAPIGILLPVSFTHTKHVDTHWTNSN
jgi:hypothetical protein